MSGIIGVYSTEDVSLDLFYGMYSIQHRGQDFLGIATIDGDDVHTFYAEGTISENLTGDQIQEYKGNIGLGHVINSYFRKEYPVQPHVFEDGSVIAIDGKIINDDFTIKELKGALDGGEREMVDFITELRGAFGIIYVKDGMMIAIRDTQGIKPLSVATRGEEVIVSSETCAFDGMGGTYYKDLIPGEIFIIEETGVRSLYAKSREHRLCLFEMLYTQRPDSVVEGISVYGGRFKSGEILCREAPVDYADIVIGAPDSGIIAALGYAEAAGIPYRTGLIKNRYVQRTFIQPTDALREMDIRLKLNAIKDVVAGKDIVLVDDSIIRGATMTRTIDILRQAGAKTVHVRVASPMIKTSDNLSIYIPDRSELVATNNSVEEIADIIGANSLAYLSIEGIREAFGNKGYYEKYFGGIE